MLSQPLQRRSLNERRRGYLENNTKIPLPLINALKLAGLIVTTLATLYLFVLVLKYAAPFVTALVFAAAVEPFTRWLSKKRKITITRPLAALIGTILVLAAVAFAIFGLGNLLVNQARELIQILPERYPDLAQNILDYIAYLERSMHLLPKEALQGIDSMLSKLEEFVTDFVSDAARYLFHYAVSLPELLLFVILTILSIYFILRDWLKIREGIDEQIPHLWMVQFRIFRRDMLAVLFGLIRAALIFMAVTFVQLFIGFLILQVQYAFLTAFIMSIFDALPIIGPGLLIIPWCIYAFITGNIKLAVGLMIIQVTISVVRQVIQPKVLGAQIGLHPLPTMIAMYVGFKLIGVSGLILGPIIYVILKSVLGYYTKGRSLRRTIFEVNGGTRDEGTDTLSQ